MSYVRKNLTNVLGSMVVVVVLTSIAIWQFYRFASFKDANGLLDLQGGWVHLAWALVMAAFACLTAFFVFSVFLRHDREDELHINS